MFGELVVKLSLSMQKSSLGSLIDHFSQSSSEKPSYSTWSILALWLDISRAEPTWLFDWKNHNESHMSHFQFHPFIIRRWLVFVVINGWTIESSNPAGLSSSVLTHRDRQTEPGVFCRAGRASAGPILSTVVKAPINGWTWPPKILEVVSRTSTSKTRDRHFSSDFGLKDCVKHI